MSDLYSTLSPSKKRRALSDEDDTVFSPKRLRTTSVTSRSAGKQPQLELPDKLTRLATINTGLQHALSHALASCAVSPTSDTGLVRNVLTHLSLSNYVGLAMQISIDDIRRLCWLWEWDAKALPAAKDAFCDQEENPFMEDDDVPAPPKDWKRGSMGIVLSSATHFSKLEGKRVPAYGIGIEVEIDIDKDMSEGMAAVARWTASSEDRRREFDRKLRRWVELHSTAVLPNIPLADLPKLPPTAKTSSLTNALLSSTKSPLKKAVFPFSTSSTPGSPTKSGFAIPFPVSSKSPSKNSLPFPQTPSRNRVDSGSTLLNPRTPRSSLTSISVTPQSLPSTPVHQRGQHAQTAPETPSTSRRQALYERIRQKSLTSSPTKAKSAEVQGGKLTRDQMLKFGQDEMRRRCLLGRLSGIAESVWMMFTGPVSNSSNSATTRKRRALPASEVESSVIKSSPVPISLADAKESLDMLVKLCPFFLKTLKIGVEDWLEMPAASLPTPEPSPTKSLLPVRNRLVAPASPGSRKSKAEINDQLLSRSPKSIKHENGGLREVREIIRREIELQD